MRYCKKCGEMFDPFGEELVDYAYCEDCGHDIERLE